MKYANYSLQDSFIRYLKNTFEGVTANLITQVLVYSSVAAPAVLPAFFNPENIFTVLLAAAIVTGIQFVLQYPAVGGVRPEDSLQEEISRLRELIQLLVSAKIVIRADGGTQDPPRLLLPRYSLILLGSALIIPLTASPTSLSETLYFIFVIGAISSNTGDAIGMVAYKIAVERYGSEDGKKTSEVSSENFEFESENEDVTSNQEDILDKLEDIRERLIDVFGEFGRERVIVAPERIETSDAFAQRVSTYVSDSLYEQIKTTQREVVSELDERAYEYSPISSEFSKFSEDIQSQLDEVNKNMATEGQMDYLLNEVEAMNERVDSIETSISSQRLDLDEFDRDDVLEAFQMGEWSIVPGIGSNKEETLRTEITSIEDLQQLSLGELEKINGIGPVLAYRLKRLEEFALRGV